MSQSPIVYIRKKLITMKSSLTLTFIPSVRLAPVAVAILLMGASQAQARIGGTPLSFSISQMFTHDTNIERKEVAESDTISTTQAGLSIDKDYGRQTYKANVGTSINRFQKKDKYNNTGVNIDLSFSTELGASSKLTLTHLRTRSLQDFDVQGTDIRAKDVNTETLSRIQGEYGLAKKWQLVGSLETGKSSYQNTADNLRTSIGRRIAIRFSPTDLLYFEGGFKDSNYKFPNTEIFSSGFTIKGDEIGRQDLNFQTGWTVTGYSKLLAQLNWTDEKHAVIGTGRDYQGLTGALSWQFTPRGKVGYSLNISHDTNDSGGNATSSRTFVRDKINTTLGGSALWGFTNKLKFSLGMDLIQSQEFEQQSSGTLIATDSKTSLRRQLKLIASYTMDRSMSFNCGLTQIHRSQSLFTNAYNSTSTNCSGTFSME